MMAKLPEDVLTLIAEACNPVVIVDRKGVIVAANQEAYDEFGYQPGELKGNPIEILIPERYRDGHVGLREGFMREPVARSTRPMGLDRCIYVRRKDGAELGVEVRLIPLAGHKFVMAHIFPVSKGLS